MDMKDLSARFKQVKGDQAADQVVEQAAPNFDEAYRIRARMVGVLLRDARVNSGRSVEDCARLLRVAPHEIEAWEYGDATPSLPQLELLAYFLDVPVSHFWGSQTLSGEHEKVVDAQSEYMALRDRMVGALLRQAREKVSKSVDDVAAETGLAAVLINSYELGEVSMPMHELTVLATAVKKNMSYFLESSSHIGELLAIREQWLQFTDLPEAIRDFAANPLNEGFIEIALMFSQMPTDKLRKVGESMLDITL